MSFKFARLQMFFAIPTVYCGWKRCQHPECGEVHKVIGASWLVWCAEVVF